MNWLCKDHFCIVSIFFSNETGPGETTSEQTHDRVWIRRNHGACQSFETETRSDFASGDICGDSLQGKGTPFMGIRA